MGHKASRAVVCVGRKQRLIVDLGWQPPICVDFHGFGVDAFYCLLYGCVWTCRYLRLRLHIMVLPCLRVCHFFISCCYVCNCLNTCLSFCLFVCFAYSGYICYCFYVSSSVCLFVCVFLFVCSFVWQCVVYLSEAYALLAIGQCSSSLDSLKSIYI